MTGTVLTDFSKIVKEIDKFLKELDEFSGESTPENVDDFLNLIARIRNFINDDQFLKEEFYKRADYFERLKDDPEFKNLIDLLKDSIKSLCSTIDVKKVDEKIDYINNFKYELDPQKPESLVNAFSTNICIIHRFNELSGVVTWRNKIFEQHWNNAISLRAELEEKTDTIEGKPGREFVKKFQDFESSKYGYWGKSPVKTTNRILTVLKEIAESTMTEASASMGMGQQTSTTTTAQAEQEEGNLATKEDMAKLLAVLEKSMPEQQAVQAEEERAEQKNTILSYKTLSLCTETGFTKHETTEHTYNKGSAQFKLLKILLGNEIKAIGDIYRQVYLDDKQVKHSNEGLEEKTSIKSLRDDVHQTLKMTRKFNPQVKIKINGDEIYLQ